MSPSGNQDFVKINSSIGLILYGSGSRRGFDFGKQLLAEFLEAGRRKT